MTLLDFMILWSLGQFYFQQLLQDHQIFSFSETMSFMSILATGLRCSLGLQVMGWATMIQHLLQLLLVFEHLPCVVVGAAAFERMITQALQVKL